MSRSPPVNTPLGRLYEPLGALATRIRRLVGGGHRTIWTDGSGRLFAEAGRDAGSQSRRTILGSYDTHTPLFVIEDALRHALRARASPWITDWNEQASCLAPSRRRPKTTTPMRERMRRVRASIHGMPMADGVPRTASVSTTPT